MKRFSFKPIPVDHQRGQSMTEFVIIAPFMILIVMGALQFAFIYNAKTTVNYATFQAARSGAVNGASLDAIQTSFARNMAALYTHDDEISAVKEGRDKVNEEIEDNFVCIQRINPPTGAFNDWADGYIPNDNLMFRDPTPGRDSGLSIQDANLLKIKVTYCFDMIVPLVNRTIAALGGSTTHSEGDAVYGNIAEMKEIREITPDAFQKRCYDNLRIPIVAQATVRMQGKAELADPTDPSQLSFPQSCAALLN